MKLKLIDKNRETGNIWSFRFRPDQDVSWQAGQSIRIEVPRKTWGYTERRFTISSLPTDNYMQITTRISESQFKQDLSELEIGSELNGHGIEGRLNWGDLSKQKVFIAGGTGAVLFYIAIRQALSQDIPAKITLLYSSKDSPMLFEEFFDQLPSQMADFKLIKSNERFDAQRITDTIRRYDEYDIHITGPDSMLFELRKLLLSAGAKAQSLDSNFLQ